MPEPGGEAAALDPFEAQRRMVLEAADYSRRLAKAMSLPDRIRELEIKGTPHDVIQMGGPIRLLHYHRLTKSTHQVPILLVYALINKPYILDIKPDRSVVRSLLVKGFDVYMIDWGEPTAEDRYESIDDYVNGHIGRAVREVTRRAKTDSVTMLGYCQGGTLSIMYASLHPEKVRNLVVMAAPFDFGRDGGLLRFWADKAYYDVDKVVDTLGNVPAGFLNMGFALLDPYNNLWGKYAKMVDGIDNEDAVDLFVRMEKWINDGVDVAGETYREFLKSGYQENLLVKGRWAIGGRTVDPSGLSMPLCVIVADYDTLVPKESTLPLLDVASSKDKKLLSLPKGHIGLSVSSEAHRELWPKVAEWLAPRSEASIPGKGADAPPPAKGRRGGRGGRGGAGGSPSAGARRGGGAR